MFPSIDNKTVLYTAAGVGVLTAGSSLWYWWDSLPSISITWGTAHAPGSKSGHKKDCTICPQGRGCKGTQHPGESVSDGHLPAKGNFSSGSKSD